ncbi:MAG: hypothetical protein ABL901_15535 [Hyphomicrobiaceae bacterium]
MMELRSTARCASFLHSLPNFIVDDALVRDILAQPLALWIFPRHALTGRWVFEKPLAIVNDGPSVEFVVEDTIEAARIAKQGRRVPSAAARGRNTFSIQIGDDRDRPLAVRILSKDPTDDVCLEFVDGTPSPILTIFDEIVAVALPARNSTFLDPTKLPAPRFLS